MVYCESFMLKDKQWYIYVPLTTNMLAVRVFFKMIVADFEVFPSVFLIKQLFYSHLLDMR